MRELLVAALDYAARGWRVFPLWWPVGRTCSCPAGIGCASPAKHPMTRRGLHEATTDAATVTAWWQRSPRANLGIATGGGLFVVDVDGETGAESCAALEQRFGELPRTVEVVTGSGGLHVYLSVDREVRNTAGQLGPKLDTRGDGGYVVAPPSLHASGGRYYWRLAPSLVAVAPAPPWLVRLLEPAPPPAPPVFRPGRRLPGDSNRPLGPIAAGHRNVELFRFAAWCRGRRGMDETAILAELQHENASRCTPPLGDRELAAIAHSVVARYAPQSEDDRRGFPNLELSR
jgi:Bifunctional DNA primase/polymerase, N-terminal/Primase C terminal 1 (PriCT-1)